MEYVYAALLLHKLGKEINEGNVKKVMEAAGATPEDARMKALVASLDGVNIDEVVQKAAMPVAAPVAAVAEAPKEEKKEEEKEDKKSTEEAVTGLGALFG